MFIRTSFHTVILLAFLSNPCTAAAPKKLLPGKEAGTFHFVYKDRVRFVGEEMFPVTVKVNAGAKTLIEQVIRDDKPFTIEADLPPGTYQVLSEPASKAATEKYWGAFGARFHIEVDGAISYMITQEIVHSLRMKILAPTMMAKVDQSRPLLKWEAIPGATEYRIGWFELAPAGRKMVKTVQNMKTAATEYQFEEDVVQKRLYEWDVWASNAAGAQIGHTNGYFLTPGVELKDILEAKTSPTPVIGTGWLGVALLEQSAVFARALDGKPGLQVMDIVAGSPAARSGLTFQDVIVKVDDNAVSSVDAFTKYVSSLAPGTKVHLTVWRMNKGAMTLDVEVGKRPAPAGADEIPK